MAITAAQRAALLRAADSPDPDPSLGPARRSAYVETYGCQMNISDGELMEGILEAEGYRIVDRAEEADVVIVNTCAIRENAERRVLGRVSQLQQLKASSPDLVIGVTGCMAQRMGDALLERAPYVDLVMGPDAYRTLPQRIRQVANPGTDASKATRAPRRQLSVLELDPRENYQGLEQRRTSGVSAWVPIQRGCNHRCTFCIVPYVRGPEKNRHPEEVLGEVRGIARGGVTEVTLLGQTVNSYESEGWSFARLLREVARVPGIRRVRFTSPHPNDVTPELVDIMAAEPVVCEQLHLPVQSGNDRVLKRMLRRYTVDRFLEKVDLVRSAIPDVALSTDVIVGFPGETEEEFQDTLELMRRVRFDDAFTYKYSPRDGTPATRLPAEEFVPDDVAQVRLMALIDTCRGIQGEINRTEVGRVEEILVERPGKRGGTMMGRTRRAKVVVFPGEADLAGAYVPVRLTETTGATFAGVRSERLTASGSP